MNYGKQRHWFVTTFLIFAMVVNSNFALIYVTTGNAEGVFSRLGLFLLGLTSVFNVVCFNSILLWKKWGFMAWWRRARWAEKGVEPPASRDAFTGCAERRRGPARGLDPSDGSADALPATMPQSKAQAR